MAVVTFLPTSRLVSAGGHQCVVAHAVSPEFGGARGIWRRSPQGTFQLVMGPLHAYVPTANGFARLELTELTELTNLDLELPTPSNLPVDDFTVDKLEKFSPPRGSTTAVVRPRRGFWDSWFLARHPQFRLRDHLFRSSWDLWGQLAMTRTPDRSAADGP